MHPYSYGNNMASTVPDINYSAPEYNFPGDSSGTPYQPIKEITLDELTTKVLNGTGSFDSIMTSVAAHLTGEFKANRITGAEYTKAYIASMTAALQAGLQFLLSKDSAYWAAIKAQADAITARVQLQTAKHQAEAAAMQVKLLGEQIKLLTEQVETQRAQTLGTRTDAQPVQGVVGAQVGLYKQQVTSYERDAEVKAAKLFTDAWITQKTMDEGLLPPSNFANASLDTILAKIKLNNQLQ